MTGASWSRVDCASGNFAGPSRQPVVLGTLGFRGAWAVLLGSHRHLPNGQPSQSDAMEFGAQMPVMIPGSDDPQCCP